MTNNQRSDRPLDPFQQVPWARDKPLTSPVHVQQNRPKNPSHQDSLRQQATNCPRCGQPSWLDQQRCHECGYMMTDSGMQTMRVLAYVILIIVTFVVFFLVGLAIGFSEM